MNKGWIKLHRSFMSWEWYDDVNTSRLFIHLLLSANHKEQKWRGVIIKRGQHITGLNSLSKATNLSVKKIRTSLNKLEKTGEIGRQKGNQFSVITINNYDSYQEKNAIEGNPEGKQGASEGQAKGNKQECKKEKNEKERYSDFVFLRQIDYQTLVKKHGKQNADNLIQVLNDYKESSGKSYPSDYGAINSWVVKATKKDGTYKSITKKMPR